MYNLLAFTVFAAGGWAVLRMARNDSGKSWSQGLPIAALAFPATVLYLTLPMVIDVATAIRYVAPVLVGIAPPCLAMGLVSLRGVRIRSFPGSGIPLVLALVLFWLFLPVTGKHLIRMSTLHTTVSFPPTEQFAKTSKEYLSSAHCAAWRDIQEKTVAGEGILVRISTPYCADFKRNHIFLASDPGLVNPAIPLGPRNKAGDLAQWLTGMGVRYVLWESSGRAIKTNQAHNQSFQKYYWLPLYRRLSVANITFHQWLSELAASPAGALILPGVYLIDLQAGASPGP